MRLQRVAALLCLISRAEWKGREDTRKHLFENVIDELFAISKVSHSLNFTENSSLLRVSINLSNLWAIQELEGIWTIKELWYLILDYEFFLVYIHASCSLIAILINSDNHTISFSVLFDVIWFYKCCK